MAHHLRGKTACVGLATAGCGEAHGRNAMELMVEAVHGALADAQIPLSEVDGVFAASAFYAMANMSLAEHLGIPHIDMPATAEKVWRAIQDAT